MPCMDLGQRPLRNVAAWIGLSLAAAFAAAEPVVARQVASGVWFVPGEAALGSAANRNCSGLAARRCRSAMSGRRTRPKTRWSTLSVRVCCLLMEQQTK